MTIRSLPPTTFLEARRLGRMSQTIAGEFAGVSRQAIGALERGERSPKVDELLRLSSLYRVRPEALLAGRRLIDLPTAYGIVAFRGGDGELDSHDDVELTLAAQSLSDWPALRVLPDVSSCQTVLEQCARVRQSVGQAAGAFDPFRALGSWNVLVRFTTLVKVDAAILHGEGRRCCAVLVNSDQPDDRLRWSAAHELAHLVLRHDGFDRAHVDLFGAPKSQDDKDADQFAAELLLPAVELLGGVMQKTAVVTLADRVYELSVEFEVSYAAMAVRLGQLGVVTPTAVEVLRKERPTALEARLLLKAGRSNKFQAEDALPTLIERLEAEGRLTPGWHREFACGWRHLRELQAAAVAAYLSTVPAAHRASSVNQIHAEVATWLAATWPCTW